MLPFMQVPGAEIEDYWCIPQHIRIVVRNKDARIERISDDTAFPMTGMQVEVHYRYKRRTSLGISTSTHLLNSTCSHKQNCSQYKH